MIDDTLGIGLVYNGECYNYRELRDELRSRGHQFRSQSDTEIVLRAYIEWGISALDRLRGMFALALWDEKQNRLLCARDRFGIKPFYYTEIDGQFIFASEIKALIPFLKDVETDSSAFAEYLTFQYTIGENTLFEGVKQLLPGQYLVVENGGVKVGRYWDVNYEIKSSN